MPEWIKAIYGGIGAEFPVLSQIIATILGAIIFGGAWWIVGKEHRKDHPPPPAPRIADDPVVRKVLPPKQYATLTIGEALRLDADASRTQLQKENEYKLWVGKYVIWRGFVADIQNGDLLHPESGKLVFSIIASPRDEVGVSVFVSGSDHEMLKRIVPGDQIEFEGRLYRPAGAFFAVEDGVILRKF